MNPLLKEIQLDRLAKEMDAKKREYGDCQSASQCNNNMYDWQNRYNTQMNQQQMGQQQMMQQPNQQQQQMGQSQQIQGSAIPQTFLPSQFTHPTPPQNFEQNFPFNPYASPQYPPGMPIPGLPGSYPQFQQQFNSMSSPPICYQQDFNIMTGPAANYAGNNGNYRNATGMNGNIANNNYSASYANRGDERANQNHNHSARRNKF